MKSLCPKIHLVIAIVVALSITGCAWWLGEPGDEEVSEAPAVAPAPETTPSGLPPPSPLDIPDDSPLEPGDDTGGDDTGGDDTGGDDTGGDDTGGDDSGGDDSGGDDTGAGDTGDVQAVVVQPPAVLDHWPREKETVDVDWTQAFVILVDFSEPMDMESVKNAVTVEYTLWGFPNSLDSFEVGPFPEANDHSNLAISSANPPVPFTLTTYHVTISDEAKSKDGQKLIAPKSWEFTVGSMHADPATLSYIQSAAQVTPAVDTRTPGVDATGVLISSEIKVVFNVEMNPSTVTADTFEVTQKPMDRYVDVPGSVQVGANNKEYIFRATGPFPYNTHHKVVIKGGADGVKSADDVAIADDVEWGFTTTGGETVSFDTSQILEPVFPDVNFDFVESICHTHKGDECDKALYEGHCDVGFNDGDDVVTYSNFKVHFTTQDTGFVYDSCGNIEIDGDPQGDFEWKWVGSKHGRHEDTLDSDATLGGRKCCQLTVYGPDNSEENTLLLYYQYGCPLPGRGGAWGVAFTTEPCSVD